MQDLFIFSNIGLFIVIIISLIIDQIRVFLRKKIKKESFFFRLEILIIILFTFMPVFTACMIYFSRFIKFILSVA
jgi:hypothetical protein